MTYDWLCHQIGFSAVSVPNTILELVHMEAVHDVFDLYLWLSYRFPDLFPDVEIVRSIQLELDSVIQEGKQGTRPNFVKVYLMYSVAK